MRLPAAIALVALAVQREQLELVDLGSTAHLLITAPVNGKQQALLALALLRPLESLAPNADNDSLYGSEFTLHHPNVARARAAVDAALAAAPHMLETHQAETAVLMAEGKGEEAIQPGRRAVDAAPTPAQAAQEQIQLARAHLLASCAMSCSARESLRAEKRAEEKAGRRKSALETREDEQRQQQEATTKGRKMDRSTQRAGAMWRIMEAGRILQQAAASAPADQEVKRLARSSKSLVKLDANKVLNTEQIMVYAQCHFFFGQQVDGAMCDAKRYSYE